MPKSSQGGEVRTRSLPRPLYTRKPTFERHRPLFDLFRLKKGAPEITSNAEQFLLKSLAKAREQQALELRFAARIAEARDIPFDQEFSHNLPLFVYNTVVPAPHFPGRA